jgi:hypothetical protein
LVIYDETMPNLIERKHPRKGKKKKQVVLPWEAMSWKLTITFNVLLWTQIILDESLLALWKTMNYFFTFVLKNEFF